MTKIGIIGSRRRDSKEDFEKLKKELLKFDGEVTLVSGGCPKGGDAFAEELAEDFDLWIDVHYPDQSKLEANTRWAYAKINYARNTLIAEDADVLIALVAPDRKGGTEDTIKKYLKMGKSRLILL